MKSLKLPVVTLSIAMLVVVSACASPPPPPPSTPNFSESEVIAIARESKLSTVKAGRLRFCWRPTGPYITNATTSASASLKKNGLWIVTAESSWKNDDYAPISYEEDVCTFLVDDATGKVLERYSSNPDIPDRP